MEVLDCVDNATAVRFLRTMQRWRSTGCPRNGDYPGPVQVIGDCALSGSESEEQSSQQGVGGELIGIVWWLDDCPKLGARLVKVTRLDGRADSDSGLSFPLLSHTACGATPEKSNGDDLVQLRAAVARLSCPWHAHRRLCTFRSRVELFWVESQAVNGSEVNRNTAQVQRKRAFPTVNLNLDVLVQ